MRYVKSLNESEQLTEGKEVKLLIEKEPRSIKKAMVELKERFK
jgi:hypothetical protein